MKLLLLLILFASQSWASESCLQDLDLFSNFNHYITDKSKIVKYKTFEKFQQHFVQELTPTQLTKEDFEYYRNNLNKPIYADINHLRPGQNRISYQQIQLRIDRILKKEKTPLTKDDGRSSLKKETAVEAILSPWGIILLDGHHSFFAQVGLGDKSFPIKITHDFSDLNEAYLINKLKQDGLLYLKSENRRSVRPVKKFSELENDPWRFIVFNLTAKIYVDAEDRIEKIVSPSFKPLLMKVNDDHHPFMEFEVADELRKSFKGIDFDLDYSDDFSKKYPEERKKMRELLERKNEKLNMSDWIIIPKGNNAADIEKEFVGKKLDKLKAQFN